MAATGASVATAPGKGASCSFGSVLGAAFSAEGGGCEPAPSRGTGESDGDGAAGGPRDATSDPVVDVAMALLIGLPVIPTPQQAGRDPGGTVATEQVAISAVGAAEAGAVSAAGDGGFGWLAMPLVNGATSEGRVAPAPGDSIQPDLGARTLSTGLGAPSPGLAFDEALAEEVDARRAVSPPMGVGIPTGDGAGSMMAAVGGPRAGKEMPAGPTQQAAMVADGATAAGLADVAAAMPEIRAPDGGNHPVGVDGAGHRESRGALVIAAEDGPQPMPQAAIEPGKDDLESGLPEPARDRTVVTGPRVGAVGTDQSAAAPQPRPFARKGDQDAEPKVGDAIGSSRGDLEGLVRVADGEKGVMRQEDRLAAGDGVSRMEQVRVEGLGKELLAVEAGRKAPLAGDGLAATEGSRPSVVDAKVEPGAAVGPVALSAGSERADRLVSAEADRVLGGQNGGEDLFGQLLAHVARLSVSRSSSLRVQLRPPSLGLVDLRLGLRDGVLTLQILAESDRTREMIQQALPDLRQHLEGKAIEVGQMSLGSTATGPSGQQYGSADLAGSGHWPARRYGHSGTGGQVAEEPPGSEGRGPRDGRPDPRRLVDYRV